MDEPRRGRLRPGRAAPAEGEETVLLGAVDGVRIEQILSGRLDAPVDYLADVDEWVVVLEDHAVLEGHGHVVDARAGRVGAAARTRAASPGRDRGGHQLAHGDGRTATLRVASHVVEPGLVSAGLGVLCGDRGVDPRAAARAQGPVLHEELVLDVTHDDERTRPRPRPPPKRRPGAAHGLTCWDSSPAPRLRAPSRFPKEPWSTSSRRRSSRSSNPSPWTWCSRRNPRGRSSVHEQPWFHHRSSRP